MEVRLGVALKVTGQFGHDYLRKTADLDVLPNKDDVIIDGGLEFEIKHRLIDLDNSVSLVLETCRFSEDDEMAEYIETMKKLGWS